MAAEIHFVGDERAMSMMSANLGRTGECSQAYIHFTSHTLLNAVTRNAGLIFSGGPCIDSCAGEMDLFKIIVRKNVLWLKNISFSVVPTLLPV